MALRPALPLATAPEIAARTALDGLGIAEIALRSPATRAVIAADPARRELMRDLIARLLGQAELVLGDE